ncbi:cation diffusion facilitator family transporter [Aureitalea marina]|uniref:Cation transporter n=1 Tax=Aureitalea marina TaxID=930804 RepID=A0A2S7KSC2_9FLAO|nr:cation diffusion facilitator family transporter [Aureitalea marina]PQB05453.1 cation transporter [Aureitalea marina]
MSHSHHHHHHDMKGKNMLIAVILNVVITVSQVIGGLISGSLSLLSDALHNFSDVLSLLISFFANRLVKRKASSRRTFGYKRAEIIAAFVNASTLLIVAAYLIYEAIVRFIYPQPIESGLVIWLAAIAIIANGISVLLLKSGSDHNMNIRSAYLHLMSDMLASVAVLVGGLLMRYFGWFWVDSVLTVCIAVYLIVVGYDLLKDSFKVLMLFTPEDVDLNHIRQELTILEEVDNVHHVHVWQLNEQEVHLEAHIEFNKDISLSQFDLIMVEIERVLDEKFGINHVNIQPEYQRDDPKDIIVQD